MLRAARRPLIPLLLAATVCLLGLISGHGDALAALAKTYQVNTTTADPTGALNHCDFPQGVGDTCSLVAAINAANAHANPQFAGPDFIRFQIAPAGIENIAPTQALPHITDPVIIDGTTQATGNGCGVGVTPCIRINSHGLSINANATTVRGLSISNTSDPAINIPGPSMNTTIVGNFIGTVDGHTFGNDEGVVIGSMASLVTIGGTTAADRNLISGALDGVEDSGSNVTIQGNYIGTTPDGTGSLANNEGIYLNNASHTTIGGTGAGSGNVISGNLLNAGPPIGELGLGIDVFQSTDTVIEGNLIGLSPDGATKVPNHVGIGALSATSTVIGGASASARNVISGNTYGVSIDNTAATIEGNYIGTNVAGDAAMGNTNYGVAPYGANAVVIGGSDAGARNVISGNGGDGIVVNGLGGSGLVVQGNYIGTNAAGTAAVRNGGDGILFAPGTNGTISNDQITGNLVSGNGANGITMAAVPQASVHDVKIDSNLIGLNAAGTAAVPNQNGVVLTATTTNPAIQSLTFTRNTIAGNSTDGIFVKGDGDGILEPFFTANFIGTNPAGTARLVNGLTAVHYEAAPDGIIDGNVIAGAAGQPAVDIAGDSTGTSWFENYIGTNPAGDNLGGQSIGMLLEDTFDEEIGSESAPQSADAAIATQGNVIRNSTSSGIEIRGSSISNHIEANSIDDNGGLGIELLGGQTNGGQAAPVLAAAPTQGASTHITGTLTSTGTSPFTIEFFASPACDPSGSGEGRTYLGSTQVTTTANVATLDATVGGTYPGQAITATATSSDGNTGEFSNCALVPGASSSPSPTPTHSPTPTPGGSSTPTPTPTHIGSPTPTGAPKLGDGDCDGDVDIDDAIAALSQFAGVHPGAPCASRADVDCDGDVDANDALRIVLYVAGTPKTPPAGCGPIGQTV